MFIPTNLDGQIFVNLRKKLIEKNKIFLPVSSLSTSRSSSPFGFYVLFFVFFSLSGTHMSLFIPFLGPFKPRNKLFCPGFNFIYPN